MAGLEEFSRAVSQIHAAAGAPQLWKSTLADIAGHLHGTACTLTIGAGHDRTIVSTNFCSEAVDTYASYYHRKDFIMQACEGSPVGLVQGGYDLVSRNKRTEFYADWQRRYEVTDGLAVKLLAEPYCSFVLSAPPDDKPYETRERVRYVNALVPHLQQALRARNQLTGAQGGPVDMDTPLTVTRHGVIVVADGGRVVQMNAAAEQHLTTGDGLTWHGHTVLASSARTNDELQAAIAKALVRHDDAARIGSYLACGRPSGKRPYIVRVIPMDAGDDPHQARAAIVVIDPELEIKPPKELLHKLFDLTRAESEIALRMLNGDGLKVIADEMRVSMSTVKTHVQRIFQKTKTHRQAELVRLLFAVVT